MVAQQYTDRIKDYLKSQFNLPGEQIDTMIPNLLKTLSGHLSNLEEKMMNGDPEELGKAGHTIKGALLNLGLHDCADIAYAIEKKGKAGQHDKNVQVLVGSLREKLAVYID